MAGRLIGNGSANSSTVASPSANRRTIERRVGSDKAAKTTSNRSGAVTGIVAVPPADISQTRYLTDFLNSVKPAVVTTSKMQRCQAAMVAAEVAAATDARESRA